MCFLYIICLGQNCFTFWMCCQCDLRWLAGKARESICANLVSELPIERWPRVNATGSLESKERGDNGCEFSIDSISIANVLNFSYVNDSRKRISTTRFQWCSANNLTTIFYVLSRFHRRWRISESYLRWSFDNSLFDENRPVVRKSVTTYPTTILLSAAIRTNEELATHLLSFVNVTMNWKSKAKVTQSILVAINMLLNNRQLFDFAGPSKTIRILVIELEALQSMWRGR